jgi:1,4-dihydroxy-2-naphthoate polyprenyltransferase
MEADLTGLNKFQRWILGARPRTLPAAAAPVVVGVGVAFLSEGQLQRPLAALIAALCAVLIQIGTNLVNDVADFEKGTDTAERLGPVRVTQAGLLTPRQVWIGVFATFGAAVLGGFYLVWVGGWPIIAIGLACIAAGLIYTVGPFALSDKGLGDLFVFIFFGLVGVCGTAYVLTDSVPASAWWAGAGVGALTTAILVVNNVRDIETDRQAGRRNLPVVFGRRAGEWEFIIMLVIGYMTPIVILGLGLSGFSVLAVFLTLPYAIGLTRRFGATPTGPAMNVILGQTAQLLLFYSLVLGLGLALSGWL